MFPSRFLAQVAVSLVLVLRANAEMHTIKFVNNCGYGTPALIYDGQNILTGDSYMSNGPWSGIAYLQTGYCNVNGENCTLLETTLINPTCAGCGSSTDISLIQPHVYSVETSFAYYGGCDGQGKICSDPDCTDAAFFNPNDNFVQVACQVNDVNLLVAFCADASQLVTGGGTTTTSASSSPATSTLPPSTLPTTSSSPPTSPPSTPSNTPSLGSSTPGSVPPVTPSAPPTTTTPTQTPTNVDDSGCGETTPTATPSEPATSPPTSAPPSTPTTTPSEPATSPPTSTPPSTPTPTPTVPETSASAPPTTTRKCRPRPTSSVPSNPAPTSPANAPTTTPSSTPSGTPDPCDDPSGASTNTPPVQRRHHRRINRIHY